MQHTFKILALAILCMAGARSANAQWEKIGWEGGQVEIKAQLGNTLYGIANYSVYKSTDWGKTWVMFNDGLPNYTEYFPAMHVFKDYLVTDTYYPTYNGSKYPFFGFSYCKENDKKWTFKLLDTLPSRYEVDVPLEIFFFSEDTILVYGGGQIDNTGFYFSSDGGKSWQWRGIEVWWSNNITMFDPFVVKSSLFFMFSNLLWESKTLGYSWDTLSSLITLNTYGEGSTFVLEDSIVLQYLVTPDSSGFHNGLYRSTDLCNTWEETYFVNQTNPYMGNNGQQNVIKKIGSKAFLLNFGYYGENKYYLYISDDLGKIWSKINLDSTLFITNILGKENYYILQTTDENFAFTKYFTTDSTFKILSTLQSSKKGIMASFRTLVAASGTNLFALPDTSSGQQYDSIMVSTNNGETWFQQLFSKGNKLDFNRWIMDGKNIYASGIQKDSLPCVFRTTDDGTTWNIVTTFTRKDTIKQLFAQGDTMVIRRKKDYLLSIDRGRSWVVLTSPAISDSVNMYYRNGMFIMLKNYFGGIYTSTNFSIDWEVEHPQGYNTYYGQYILGDRMFIGASNYPVGLYFRTKENNHWDSCGGFKNLSLLPNTDDGSNIYAIINESGYNMIFVSLDSGSNWQQLGEPVTNSTDVFVGSDYIFLAGPNELWRAPKSILPTAKVAPQENISSISITDCYPNPANDQVRISCKIKKRGDILLRAYDMTGKIIATIMNGSEEAGSIEAIWNTKSLPSGSYIIELSSGGEKVTREVEIVK
jgi:hypothetical protein